MMRQMYLSLAAVTLLPQVVIGICFSTLEAIYNTEASSSLNTLVRRQYVLCPDSTFKIGKFNDNDQIIEGSDYPLLLFRPNVRILCGDNGSSSNNCIFSGGDYPVEIIKPSLLLETDLTDEVVANIEIRGVTFTGAKISSFYADSDSPGSIKFTDCIWTKNIGFGPIWMGEGDTPLITPNVQLTIDSSTFKDNIIDTSLEEVFDTVYVNYWAGLISSEGQDLEVTNCMFENNDLGASVVDFEFTYGILQYEGIFKLENNCFIDNKSSLGTLLTERTTAGTMLNNYGEGNSLSTPGVGCEEVLDVLVGSSLEDPRAARYSCIFFDAMACPLLPTASPTTAPTVAPKPPTVSPSPTLSHAPTDLPTISAPPTTSSQPSEKPVSTTRTFPPFTSATPEAMKGNLYLVLGSLASIYSLFA